MEKDKVDEGFQYYNSKPVTKPVSDNQTETTFDNKVDT